MQERKVLGNEMAPKVQCDVRTLMPKFFASF